MTSRLHDHIEKIRLFVAVARAGSFHEAAKRVRLTQPTLSHAIKVLEESIEVRLFIRSQKGVRLTPAGESLLHFGEKLALDTDAAERRVRGGRSDTTELIRAGTFASFVSYLWPSFLKDLRKKHKNIGVALATLKVSEVDEALRTGRCDVILSTHRSELREAVNVAIFKDHYGFYSLKSRSKAKRADAPLIYVPGAEDGEGNSLEQILWKKTLPTPRNCTVDTFESAKLLAEAGLGIAVLPARLAKTSKLLAPVKGTKEFGAHTIYLNYLIGTKAHSGLKPFTDELKKHAAKKIKA